MSIPQKLVDQIRNSKIQVRKISGLIPYVRNARTHSEAQIAQIAGSILEYGFTNPVLIDEMGEIIAGHGRILAARNIGLDDIPTITIAGLTRNQKRAYALADNRIALNSGWNNDLLKFEIAELKDDSFDVKKLGFDEIDLGNLFPDDNIKIDPENRRDEWADANMPDHDEKNPAFRKLVISFDSPEDVDNFFQLIDQSYTPKTKSIWYPEKAKTDLDSMRYDIDIDGEVDDASEVE